jgi:predicted membrane protein
MKKIVLVIGIMVAIICVTTAQDFKLAKTTGRLEIHLGNVRVEGHNGNEIIFSSLDNDRDEDEDNRSKGLRAINGSGLDDNTGLGINVADKGNVVEVYQLKKMNSPEIKILVPKGMIVSYEHSSQYGGDAVFKNLENEIEISTHYNSVELENITGPVTAKVIYGHIEANFSQNVKGPLSLVSIYGYVDVTLPLATKANLKLATSYGEILVAPEYKIDIDKDGGMVQYSDKVNGKINGGGMGIDIRSDYGKVYLRKK